MTVLPELVSLLPTGVIKSFSRSQWKHPLLKRCFTFTAARLRQRDGNIRKGAGKGLLFNAGNANAGFMLGTSEPAIQALLQGLVQEGFTVYDIGANVGFLSLIAGRLVGSGGHVACFEPLPQNVDRLRHNAQMNGFDHLSVHAIAVADGNRTARFVTSAEPTWGKLASLPGTVAGQNGEIEVPAYALDSYVRSHGLPSPDLIKIDVEGAEVGVLQGAQDLLREQRPLLLIELHGTNKGVEQELRQLRYQSFVVGRDCAISDAPWDAYVAAAACQRPDQVELIRSLCLAQTSTR